MKTNKILHSKSLKSGEHYVYISVYNGKTTDYFNTNIKTLPKCWNNEKRIITSKDKDYKRKNQSIKSELMRIENRLKEIEAKSIPYDKEIIKSNCEIEAIVEHGIDTTNFVDIWQKYINSKDKLSTKISIQTYKKILIGLRGDNIPINQITDDYIKSLYFDLKNENPNNGYKVNRFMQYFRYVIKWANLNINVPHTDKVSEKKITKEINETFVSSVINEFKKGLMFSLDQRIKSDEDLKTIKGLYFWVLSFALNGLAPVDLIHLKRNQLQPLKAEISYNKEKYLNNEEYRNKIDSEQLPKIPIYKLNIKRQKTGSDAEIVVVKNVVDEILKLYDIINPKGEYLIDCFDNEYWAKYNQLQTQNDKDEFEYKTQCRYLKSQTKYFNIAMGWKNVTLYSARHGFVNTIINDDTIPFGIKQKMIGHKSVMMQYYVNEPSLYDKAIVSYNIFNAEKTIDELKKKQNQNQSEFKRELIID